MTSPASHRASARWYAGLAESLRPPAKLSLSMWADRYYRLSAQSSAEPGRWRTRSYQRGILDAVTDPSIERISVKKSARVGYTLCIGAAIAYHMQHDPCPIMVVQPTVDTAKKYSKEFIAPMLRDVEVLADVVARSSVKTSGRTLLDKEFDGGVLSLVGANSGTGFRMSSRRVVIFDEVDGYPASAGDEGDPIALGENRAQEFWNRKIIAGSTPLTAGSSRIEDLFEAGDRRRFYVPCPECGHMDVLQFRQSSDELVGGHRMRWPDDRPGDACFQCGLNGCVIEETHKRAMLDAGEWRAEGEFNGHASFHIWAAYSMSPNATWGAIAKAFVKAKGNVEKLKVFVTTMLGETWQDRGEAPAWESLYQRREPYQIGTVPAGAIALTAGVDVQKDRLVYEVVGWAPNKESWSIEIGTLWGDPAVAATWAQLDALLAREFAGSDGEVYRLARMAVDSSAFTQLVYGWCRRHPMSRVMAIKGVSGMARVLVGAPSPVEVTVRGKRMQRGYKVWPIGVDPGKGELYSWLGLVRIAGEDPPAGYCHFPEYDEDYFKQLTAEHLVTVVNRRTGRAKLEWHKTPNQANEHLDCRVYARAAAASLGIDRMASSDRPRPAPAPAGAPAPVPVAAPTPAPAPPPSAPAPRRSGGWLGRRRDNV